MAITSRWLTILFVLPIANGCLQVYATGQRETAKSYKENLASVSDGRKEVVAIINERSANEPTTAKSNMRQNIYIGLAALLGVGGLGIYFNLHKPSKTTMSQNSSLVETSSPHFESFDPTLIIVIGLLCFAVAVAGALYYWKKQRQHDEDDDGQNDEEKKLKKTKPKSPGGNSEKIKSSLTSKPSINQKTDQKKDPSKKRFAKSSIQDTPSTARSAMKSSIASTLSVISSEAPTSPISTKPGRLTVSPDKDVNSFSHHSDIAETSVNWVMERVMPVKNILPVKSAQLSVHQAPKSNALNRSSISSENSLVVGATLSEAFASGGFIASSTASPSLPSGPKQKVPEKTPMKRKGKRKQQILKKALERPVFGDFFN